MISTVKGSFFGNSLIKQANGDAALSHLGASALGIAIVKGATPAATLATLGISNISGALARGTVGVDVFQTWTRPINGGVSHIQAAEWSIGRYSAASLSAFTQLDLGLSEASGGFTTNIANFRSNGFISFAPLGGAGKVVVGKSTENGSGQFETADHATAAGGYGFRSGLSLYSIGAGEIRATGDFTTDGRIGANNYGSHALAALTVGDNGYGSYVDSVGLIQYHRNLNNGKIYFRNSGNTANALEVENTFVNVLSELRIAGIKVLGSRGAAVADATGAGDVVAQLNALLARVRAHGLIA